MPWMSLHLCMNFTKVVKIIFHPNRNINLDFRGFLLSHDKVMGFSMEKDHSMQEQIKFWMQCCEMINKNSKTL